jgi:hypothetical protein
MQRNGLWCAFAAFVLSVWTARASAQVVVVLTSPTRIEAAQNSIQTPGGPVLLSNADLVVRGTTLTINGSHFIRSLTVERAGGAPGVVTHDTGYTQGMQLVLGFNLVVQGPVGGVPSRVDASGRGWAGGLSGGPGPGAGQPGTGGFGGTPAQIGFDAGDSRNFVALPMSRSMAILQVCGSSNVPGGEPGLWRFQIRGGGNDIFGCTGGGQRCNVAGQRGICAEGVQVCTGMTTTCRQVNMPRARACNGLDNDCDGMPDTDDSLCGTGQICELGACVDRCQSELGCPTGRECTPRGACVEAACLNTTCPAEQVCRGGRCVAVCDGITCPHDRYCRAGRCIDPCGEITCGAQEVCEVDPRNAVGRCVTACQCRPCAMGQACEANGRCVDMACAGVTCPTGNHCAAGTCRDSCEVGPDARLCPNGEMCELGECVPQRRGGADLGAADVEHGQRHHAVRLGGQGKSKARRRRQRC